MEITHIILRVTDLERSVGFWSETVGLDVVFAGDAFTFLDGGGVRLALNEIEGPVDDPSLTEIVFESHDVISTHAALLKRGVPFDVEPRPVSSDSDRDLLAAHFRDPDGHLASLTGWVDRG